MVTIQFNVDESWELMSFVLNRMLAEVDISKSDRAKVRRWKSSEMRTNGEDMHVLGEKINTDISRLWDTRRKGHIRTSDWR